MRTDRVTKVWNSSASLGNAAKTLGVIEDELRRIIIALRRDGFILKNMADEERARMVPINWYKGRRADA